MTTDQLSEMTDYEKRIAIGQICGLSTEARPLWDCDCLNYRGTNFRTEDEARASMATWCTSPEYGQVWKNGQEWSDFFPDYLNSRDAISAACRDNITEKVQQAAFGENLIQILNRRFDGEHRFLGATPFHLATAEAADLCSAFLITMLP